MSVWFLPENLASLWFPEVSYTRIVASKPCSGTRYCMNPRTEHDYVPSWRQGHRLPCCGELCTEEAQHPMGAPIPWASHLTRRTTLPRPKSWMSFRLTLSVLASLILHSPWHISISLQQHLSLWSRLLQGRSQLNRV